MKKNRLTDILNIDKLIALISKFVEIKIEVYELKVKEQLVSVMANLAALVLILSFGLCALFFISLAMSFYLNSVIGNEFMGFVCVGGFYLLISILLVLFRNKLITNQLFQAIFGDSLTEDKNESDIRQQE